jgi:DNA repair protein RAD7
LIVQTIYTVNASDGSGLLCHTCAKASGQNPFQKAKPSKPVARKREARQVVNFEERHFPSLVSVCIDIVSKHINDVEAIGSLTSSNTSDIAKAICKNRTL